MQRSPREHDLRDAGALSPDPLDERRRRRTLRRITHALGRRDRRASKLRHIREGPLTPDLRNQRFERDPAPLGHFIKRERVCNQALDRLRSRNDRSRGVGPRHHRTRLALDLGCHRSITSRRCRPRRLDLCRESRRGLCPARVEHGPRGVHPRTRTLKRHARHRLLDLRDPCDHRIVSPGRAPVRRLLAQRTDHRGVRTLQRLGLRRRLATPTLDQRRHRRARLPINLFTKLLNRRERVVAAQRRESRPHLLDRRVAEVRRSPRGRLVPHRPINLTLELIGLRAQRPGLRLKLRKRGLRLRTSLGPHRVPRRLQHLIDALNQPHHAINARRIRRTRLDDALAIVLRRRKCPAKLATLRRERTSLVVQPLALRGVGLLALNQRCRGRSLDRRVLLHRSRPGLRGLTRVVLNQRRLELSLGVRDPPHRLIALRDLRRQPVRRRLRRLEHHFRLGRHNDRSWLQRLPCNKPAAAQHHQRRDRGDRDLGTAAAATLRHLEALDQARIKLRQRGLARLTRCARALAPRPDRLPTLPEPLPLRPVAHLAGLGNRAERHQLNHEPGERPPVLF